MPVIGNGLSVPNTLQSYIGLGTRSRASNVYTSLGRGHIVAYVHRIMRPRRASAVASGGNHAFLNASSASISFSLSCHLPTSLSLSIIASFSLSKVIRLSPKTSTVSLHYFSTSLMALTLLQCQ